MNWFVFQIAAGHTYFAGIALLLVGLFLASQSQSLFRRLRVLAVLIGAIAIAISSTAVPWWMYILAAIAALFLLASSRSEKRFRVARCLLVVLCLLAAAIEVPWHIMPRIERVNSRTLMVVGDSVTAGTGAGDKSVKWPALIGERYSIHVDDRSQSGFFFPCWLIQRLRSTPYT